MVEDLIGTARNSFALALANLVIPVVVVWANASEASATANVGVDVEVVANSAGLFIATALVVFVVVELICCAFNWYFNPFANTKRFVPVVV
jgi:hypothetical protein